MDSCWCQRQTMEQLHTTKANVWPGDFTPDIHTEEQY